MIPRLGRVSTAVLSVFLLGSILPVAAALGSEAPPMSHPWISQAEDPRAVADALAAHPDKIPAEFRERLRWTLPDGTLRVMVALDARNADEETFVKNNTTWVQWYGDAPRFLGRVTQGQLVALLEAEVVAFVEPDYPITNFMSTSTIDVHARSVAGDGTGVWSYDRNGGAGGSLRSDHPALTVDQATGKGVTVAITDSGIDRTHRDFGGWNCAAGVLQPCESRIVHTVSVDQIVETGADPSNALPTTEVASGHGTHVAGTVAGNSYYTRFDPTPDTAAYAPDGHNFGIAPQANLISTKNGDTIWAGLSSFGLQWQLDHAQEYGIRVSSNSWGCLGGCSFNGSSSTAQLFKDMYNAGIVVVFAAGNDGGGSDGRSFSGNAQSPYVLGVANYDDANRRLAGSSSRGSDNTLPAPSTWTPQSEPVNGERRPDVGAPGTSIWSARTLTGGAASGIPRVVTSDVVGGSGSGIREYVQMSGTSMATPHVAGAAALMFSSCPAATPLDVMRAVMVGADPLEILKTSGTAKAEPFEIGYGSLEIRRSVDWLLTRQACGGTGGGDPTPDPSTDPTSEPTPGPTEPVDNGTYSEATYYLHSTGAVGNIDELTNGTTFSPVAPTVEGDAVYYDVPAFIHGKNPSADPIWVGEIGSHIDKLKVDFWQRSPVGQSVGLVDYEVGLHVGENTYDLPPISPGTTVGNVSGITRVAHTFKTMLNDSGGEVPLSIDPGEGPATIYIRGHFVDAQSVAEIRYDSTTRPSSFTVFTRQAGPAPEAPTTVEFTSATAGGVQYSDTAVVAAKLTSNGAPIINADLTFELTGVDGSREWTATTDPEGVASSRPTFNEVPGSYELTVRYAGSEGSYLPSADTAPFAIDREDSATALDVVGGPRDRSLSASVMDADSSVGIADLGVEFFANGKLLGTDRTDGSGVASFALPPRYRNPPHEFEAVFGGNIYYGGSSDRRQT